MEAKELKFIFEKFISITYPIKTLKRRLSFLTEKEKEKINKKYNKIVKHLEKIDEIISIRAEIKKDSWP